MTDKKFTVTEESTSKHPHDWGRAMAVAISRLTDLAREAGDTVHDEALIGEDLQLFVEDTEDGVNISMSWTPGEQASAPSETPARPVDGVAGHDGGSGHGAADRRIDPAGGSTTGVGQ
ncbi:hypothetical protein IWX63_002096 [Arthrobacter sp. CAN_A2]|uniref:hypothetical protein n=1 Tax=Arthrobacter sp. CAN_A2 TaxID=2787718 RepID=UPI0018EFBC3D